MVRTHSVLTTQSSVLFLQLAMTLAEENRRRDL